MKDPRRMSTEELKVLKELTQTLLTEPEHEEQRRCSEQQSERRASEGAWIRLEKVRCGQKLCRKCSEMRDCGTIRTLVRLFLG